MFHTPILHNHPTTPSHLKHSILPFHDVRWKLTADAMGHAAGTVNINAALLGTLGRDSVLGRSVVVFDELGLNIAYVGVLGIMSPQPLTDDELCANDPFCNTHDKTVIAWIIGGVLAVSALIGLIVVVKQHWLPAAHFFVHPRKD